MERHSSAPLNPRALRGLVMPVLDCKPPTFVGFPFLSQPCPVFLCLTLFSSVWVHTMGNLSMGNLSSGFTSTLLLFHLNLANYWHPSKPHAEFKTHPFIHLHESFIFSNYDL